MRQGSEYSEEVKCVYQNVGPTSQAKLTILLLMVFFPTGSNTFSL